MPSFRKSVLAIAAGALLLAAASAVPASARVIDGVVATVDGEPITFSEVREAVSEALGVPPGDADAWLRDEKDPARIIRMIEPLVESLLVRRALEGTGAAVDNQAIEAAIESVRKGNRLSVPEFEAALSREGVPMALYRKRVRWQMERGNLVRMRKMKEVTVTDDEVKAWFQEQAERFREGAEVRFETLLLPAPSGGADPGENTIRLRLAAQQAAESLRAGRSMKETEALLRDAVPGVRLVEADFMKTDDLSPDLARELHRLRSGETSAPFFTAEDARIVRLAERRGGTPPDLAAVKDALAEELTDRRSEKAYSDLMTELKKSASIEIRL
jgi:peptidyl-prolyl cis-trans isomerase SurA